MNLILLGAPGAGKGTQAEVICDHLNIPAISTGNIIREALKNGTEMGKRAKSYMDEGKLVPDEVVIGIIKERLAKDDCKNGFILDGFPRTVPQAEALDAHGDRHRPGHRHRSRGRGHPETAFRAAGLRRAAALPITWITNPPKRTAFATSAAGRPCQRKDDHPDTIKERLSVYHDQTEPLKGYYEKTGKLKIVEGQEDVADTTKLTLQALEA